MQRKMSLRGKLRASVGMAGSLVAARCAAGRPREVAQRGRRFLAQQLDAVSSDALRAAFAEAGGTLDAASFVRAVQDACGALDKHRVPDILHVFDELELDGAGRIRWDQFTAYLVGVATQRGTSGDENNFESSSLAEVCGTQRPWLRALLDAADLREAHEGFESTRHVASMRYVAELNSLVVVEEKEQRYLRVFSAPSEDRVRPTATLRWALPAGGGPVASVEYCCVHRKLALVHENGALTLCDVRAQTEHRELHRCSMTCDADAREHAMKARLACYASSCDCLFVLGPAENSRVTWPSGGVVACWSLKEDAAVRLLSVFRAHHGGMYACCAIPHHNALAIGCCDGKVVVYDLADIADGRRGAVPKVAHVLSGSHRSAARSLVYSSDHNLLVSCCYEPEASCWDPGVSGPVALQMRLVGHRAPLRQLALLRLATKQQRGTLVDAVLTLDVEGSTRVWDLDRLGSGYDNLGMTARCVFSLNATVTTRPTEIVTCWAGRALVAASGRRCLLLELSEASRAGSSSSAGTAAAGLADESAEESPGRRRSSSSCEKRTQTQEAPLFVGFSPWTAQCLVVAQRKAHLVDLAEDLGRKAQRRETPPPPAAAAAAAAAAPFSRKNDDDAPETVPPPEKVPQPHKVPLQPTDLGLSALDAAELTAAASCQRCRKLFTGDAQGKVVARTLALGTVVATFHCHRDRVTHVVYVPEDSILVTIGAERCIAVHDGKVTSSNDDHQNAEFNRRTRLRCVREAHEGPISTCAVSRRLSLIATGSADLSVRCWDLCSLRLEHVLGGGILSTEPTAVAFVEPFAAVAVAHGSGAVTIFAVRPHLHCDKPLVQLAAPSASPFLALCVAQAGSRPRVVAGDDAGTLRFWNLGPERRSRFGLETVDLVAQQGRGWDASKEYAAWETPEPALGPRRLALHMALAKHRESHARLSLTGQSLASLPPSTDLASETTTRSVRGLGERAPSAKFGRRPYAAAVDAAQATLQQQQQQQQQRFRFPAVALVVRLANRFSHDRIAPPLDCERSAATHEDAVLCVTPLALRWADHSRSHDGLLSTSRDASVAIWTLALEPVASFSVANRASLLHPRCCEFLQPLCVRAIDASFAKATSAFLAPVPQKASAASQKKKRRGPCAISLEPAAIARVSLLEQAKRLRPRTAPTPQRAHCSLSVRAAAADLINVGSPQRLKHPAPAPADANASRPASAGPSSSDAPLPALPDDEGLRMEGYSHHAREKLLSASKSATAHSAVRAEHFYNDLKARRPSNALSGFEDKAKAKTRRPQSSVGAKKPPIAAAAARKSLVASASETASTGPQRAWNWHGSPSHPQATLETSGATAHEQLSITLPLDSSLALNASPCNSTSRRPGSSQQQQPGSHGRRVELASAARALERRLEKALSEEPLATPPRGSKAEHCAELLEQDAAADARVRAVRLQRGRQRGRRNSEQRGLRVAFERGAAAAMEREPYTAFERQSARRFGRFGPYELRAVLEVGALFRELDAHGKGELSAQVLRDSFASHARVPHLAAIVDAVLRVNCCEGGKAADGVLTVEHFVDVALCHATEDERLRALATYEVQWLVHRASERADAFDAWREAQENEKAGLLEGRGTREYVSLREEVLMIFNDRHAGTVTLRELPVLVNAASIMPGPFYVDDIERLTTQLRLELDKELDGEEFMAVLDLIFAARSNRFVGARRGARRLSLEAVARFSRQAAVIVAKRSSPTSSPVQGQAPLTRK